MTELKLYNTLTRTKEVFKPIDPANVRMYVCGPTVYDFAHIGNARPAIVFDVLYRLIRHLYGEDHVTYVRNITDVDDKINARALRDFGAEIEAGSMSLNEAIRRVTETTAKQYHEDVAALGCLPPTHEPRATEHIDGMVAMIQSLLDKGNAYLATGGEGAEILFDVASMPDYGALSRRKLEDQQAGARVAVEAHKKNPADFVLWKESDATAPGWDAAFTVDGGKVLIRGRPGWHIECSVMSEAFLGQTFDIHGGGLDLIFPHHENEIAQSRCAHGGAVMANTWMHNGFVQVEGRKMAKSEGNFVTIHDLLHTDKFGGRKWPGEVLRLAMLMTHYREPIDFSISRLEEADARLSKWYGFLKKTLFTRYQYDRASIASAISAGKKANASLNGFGPSLIFDDLSLNVLFTYFDGTVKDFNSGADIGFNRQLNFLYLLELCGLASVQALVSLDPSGDVDAESTEVEITRRLTLLAEKNFAEADKIRDDLAAQGIQLMDYKDPETGERRTKWEVKR